MREILFRGKRCDNGEWVQGYYIRADHHWHNHGIHKDWITLGASANGGWFALHNKYAVKAETIGQFTGLTDRNGKKIFEGDILKHQINIKTAIVGTIIFACGSFAFDSPSYFDGEWVSFADSEIVFPEKDIEVIGNIQDNPELLENP